MKQVKITVLKRAFFQDVVDEYAMPDVSPCPVFKEGQVFYAGRGKPEGFCDTAWKCIFQYVFALQNGGGKEGFFFGDWIKEPGVAISSCNDGLRPVVFKIESTDIEVVKDI